MLKQITLENWKSFRHAELYIDPLKFLIGTNASGKSGDESLKSYQPIKPSLIPRRRKSNNKNSNI